MKILSPENQNIPKSKTEIFVRKWIDCSDKYGIGYLLSNGSSGVYFNDSSNVVMGQNSSKVYYIEKKSEEKKNEIECYTLEDYPKEIEKKIKLFQYFQNYLNQKQNQNAQNEEIDENNLVYLRFWVKKSKCLMFILSTKIMQFNFNDKTELVINKKRKLVIYFDKNCEKKVYPLNSALESSNLDMTKRLRYAMKIYSELASRNVNRQKL